MHINKLRIQKGELFALGRDTIHGCDVKLECNPMFINVSKRGGVTMLSRIKVQSSMALVVATSQWISCSGVTFIGALQVLESHINLTQVNRPKLLVSVAQQFIATLKSEMTNRARWTLFRFLRRCVFQHTIHKRVQARVAFGMSPVFRNFPSQVVHHFAKEWL